MAYSPQKKKVVVRREESWFSLNTALIALLVLVGVSVLVVAIITLVKVNDISNNQLTITVPSPEDSDVDLTAEDKLIKTQTGSPTDARTNQGQGQGQDGGCNNCLRPILEEALQGVDNISATLDEWLVFGQSTCNAQLGIYNVSSYFPSLTPEYQAIIRFDNVRQPTDFSDPTRTNITYFPAVPAAFPGGTGLGINLPTLAGNVLNHSRYKKFQAVPYSIGFYFNLSMATISPTDPRLSVFVKNVEDRGPNNLENRRYKAALTKSKVAGRYAGRIKQFAASLYNAWVINKAPILSTFKDSLVDFFLDIHLGTNDHPPFVKEYFSDFLFFVSTVDTNPVAAVRTMKGHMNTKCVREYIQGRIAMIAAGTMTDTITWHWIKAGMPIESVAMEAIHNIVAFAQFDHTIQLLVTQAMNPALTPGTGGQSFLALFRAAGAGIGYSFVLPPPYYNASIYTGTPEQLQINVMREYLRIMLPNNLWFSTDVSNLANSPQHIQSRHIPQVIQIRAEYEKAGLATQWFPAGSPGWNSAVQLYGVYNPIRYTSFMAKFSDAVFGGTATSPAYDVSDTTAALVASIAAFTVSPVDNETQIPSGDASMIPVFPQPIYAPFGLGARRCPGEIFNQFIILELFNTVKCLNFYDDCVLNPSRCDPSSPNYTYTPIPLAPFKARPDSLFVSSVTPACA